MSQKEMTSRYEELLDLEREICDWCQRAGRVTDGKRKTTTWKKRLMMVGEEAQHEVSHRFDCPGSQ